MSKQFSSYQQSRVGTAFQFDVDSITGLTPTICITQKQTSYSQRSDIAKQTGIDQILRFAFSRKSTFEGEDLSASHFSNNHELGRCAVCEGIGEELLPDLDKIVLNSNLSISEGLFEHNKTLDYYGNSGSQYMAFLKEIGTQHDFSLETPFIALSEQQKELIFKGTGEKIWETNWNYKTKTNQGSQSLSMKWEGIFNYLKNEYYLTRKNKFTKNLLSLFS